MSTPTACLRCAALETANQYLEEEFLGALNEQFTVAAREKADVHRSVRRGVKLEHVLSFREERVVQNDWTVSWCNRHFQLSAEHHKLSLARKRITVSELLDGTIRLTYRGKELKWVELRERPSRKRSKAEPKKGAGKAPHKPAANHAWRRSFMN